MGSLHIDSSSRTTTSVDTDSEWEYEYDREETEDLYFTLDLTSHESNALRTREVSINGKSKPQVMDARDVQRRGMTQANTASASSATKESREQMPAGQMQVLDLHTKSPLIKFNEEVYSCYWLADYGSQFYVTGAGVTGSPLRPGRLVDVVGISQARLVGKPVTVMKRRDTAFQTTGTTSANAIAVDNDDDSDTDAYSETDDEASLGPTDQSIPGPDQPVVIDRSLLKDPTQEAQAQFVERLAAMKRQKGNNDVVPIMSVRHYDPPDGKKAEIRQQALGSGPAPPVIGKPSTFKRKRRSYAELGKKTKADYIREEREAKRMKNGNGTAARTPQSADPSAADGVAEIPSQAGPWYEVV